jgi:hypothetical protein
MAADPRSGGDAEAQELNPKLIIGYVGYGRALAPSQIGQTHGGSTPELITDVIIGIGRSGRQDKMIGVIKYSRRNSGRPDRPPRSGLLPSLFAYF